MSSTSIAAGLICFQLLTTSIILGFTGPKSLLRVAALPITVISPYMQLFVLDVVPHHILRAFFGAAGTFLVILYVELALISRWTFDAKGPTSSLGGLVPAPNTCVARHEYSEDKGTSGLRNLRFGLTMALQCRFPSTKWPVKNIPPFSRTRPSHVPSRSKFLSLSLLECVVCTYLLRLIPTLGDSNNNPTLFSLDKVPILWRDRALPREELAVRLLGVAGYWIVQYIVIRLAYGMVSLLVVSLGISTVKACAPVFGSLDQAWSIRQFWSCFYHQLIRRGCSGIAYFGTFSLLRLRKGELVGRYVFITLVFTVSGVFHLLCDMSQGVPRIESGAIQFFVSQALGIMFEDAIQAVCGLFLGAELGRWKVLTRAIGYIWVVTWLVWTSPVWVYPTMMRDTGSPIIPF